MFFPMLQKAWKRLQMLNFPFLTSKKFQGHDLNGNMYFETILKGQKSKRTVTYKDSKLNHHTLYNTESIPIQWQSWMRHTRQDPPTIEELNADVKRFQDLQKLIAQQPKEEKIGLKAPQDENHIESWNPKK